MSFTKRTARAASRILAVLAALFVIIVSDPAITVLSSPTNPHRYGQDGKYSNHIGYLRQPSDQLEHLLQRKPEMYDNSIPLRNGVVSPLCGRKVEFVGVIV